LFLSCPGQPVVLDRTELQAELDAVPLHMLLDLLREDAE
jgi:hypothetical protein